MLVDTYNNVRGFGLLTDPNYQGKIFFHITAVYPSDAVISVGDHVKANCVFTNGRWVATRVEKLAPAFLLNNSYAGIGYVHTRDKTVTVQGMKIRLQRQQFPQFPWDSSEIVSLVNVVLTWDGKSVTVTEMNYVPTT